MDLTAFRQASVSKVEKKPSPNNPNTTWVVTTYLYVANNTTYRLKNTKIYTTEKRVANKRKYYINSTGVCKRAFLTHLNTIK